MGFEDSIGTFHERAREARGLADFGEDDYMEALARLCRSLDQDARLSPIGVLAFETQITDALEARLMVEEGWKRAPEAAEATIPRPLVIVGLPRTGTTALHHLMAQDPSIQALEHWLQRTPKPRPPRVEWNRDPDYRVAVARVASIYERSPEMRAIHEIEADLPDECWNTFAQNFVHSGYQANADVSQYARWWPTSDLAPVYRRHRRTARLIGHREPEKRWLFKDATHLFDLPALLATYPDACIVQTHRDPLQLIPSVCSLCASARRALNEELDRKALGRATLELWEHSIYSMMRARAGRPSEQFYDLSFDRWVQDPVASIEAIYRHFDMDYTPAAEQAMQRFRAARPKGRHGEHAYSLESWGLDAEDIARRFAPYTEAYGIETGAAAK